MSLVCEELKLDCWFIYLRDFCSINVSHVIIQTSGMKHLKYKTPFPQMLLQQSLQFGFSFICSIIRHQDKDKKTNIWRLSLSIISGSRFCAKTHRGVVCRYGHYFNSGLTLCRVEIIWEKFNCVRSPLLTLHDTPTLRQCWHRNHCASAMDMQQEQTQKYQRWLWSPGPVWHTSSPLDHWTNDVAWWVQLYWKWTLN